MSRAGSVLSSLVSPQGGLWVRTLLQSNPRWDLETTPGGRRSGQLPLLFHSLSLWSKQERKKKGTNTILQVCLHPLKKLRPGN